MTRISASPRRWRRIAVGMTAAAFAIAGIAGASWSAQGTGNAKAQAGRLEAVTATPATPTGELYPGQSSDAALSLTNPNPVAMTVSAIAGNGAISSDSSACDAAGHGVTFADQTGSWEVAKNASLALSLPDAVAMASDSATECQGATFTIPVMVTASVSGQGGGGTPTTTTTVAPTTTTTAPAQLAWQPSNVSYPSTEVGSQNGPVAQISLRNSGGAPGQIETGTLGNSEFVVLSNNCGATLAPAQMCTLSVRFNPAQAGMRTGILQARLVGASNWTTANMFGQGYTQAALQFFPSSRDFGSQNVNSEGAPFTFELRNVGQAPANQVTLTLQGADAASFAIKGNNCSFLNPGQSCFVGVSFRPGHSGPNNASLRATWATSTSTMVTTAGLSGTGV